MKRNKIFVPLLITLILTALCATAYAQIVVQIGTPSSPTDLGIFTSQGYWIGPFPVTMNGKTGAAYCLTPDGTVYFGASYTSDEVLVPTHDTTWQAISYLLSWSAPRDAISGAIDQVAIWQLLGDNPPYADFTLDSSITNPAAILAANASGKNTALPDDRLMWISPASGTATANAGDTVSFLVQLSSARPNVRIDFTANLTSPSGSSITLSSAYVSPIVTFTDGAGMAQVSVTVPSDAPVGSTIAVAAYTQSVWPTEYLDLLNYNSGAQNLLGVGPALNLTANTSASVSQSLTVKAHVTIKCNIDKDGLVEGSVNQPSGSYGQDPTTITATANPGYQFVDWVATGGVSLTSTLASTTTFTASGLSSIEAFFKPLTPIQISSIEVPMVATQTGFTMPSSLTLTNPNSVLQIANIQVSTGSAVVFNSTLTLDPRQTQVVPCSISTNSLPIGAYSFTVTVTTTSLPDSTPQTVNAQSGITCLGDLNGDRIVNFADLCIFATEYISHYSGTYHSNIDFYHTGNISFNDVSAFVNSYIQYGKWAST